MRYVILGALLTLSACAPKAEEPRRAIVTTRNGPVIGIAGKGFFRFDNLPYSQAVKPWATPRDASTPGAACSTGATDSDPCLNLTLIAPYGQTRAPVDISFDPAATQTPGHILIIAHVRPDIPEDPKAIQLWAGANVTVFGGDPNQMRVIGPKNH